MQIATQIKRLKSKYGMSISAISRAVGVNRGTIYYWLSNPSIPHNNNLEKLNILIGRKKQEAE